MLNLFFTSLFQFSTCIKMNNDVRSNCEGGNVTFDKKIDGVIEYVTLFNLNRNVKM